ncbi:MAG: hypothetical protein LBT60_02740 [Oscillospiraceae bacterium]|jgi:hypothetical protein|nr:hypothetical protein [Oscillospiraceae bacterium]
MKQSALKVALITLLVLLTALVAPIDTFAVAPLITFTPAAGTVYTYQSGDHRYAQLTAMWNSAGIAEFNATNDTYEHELIFYNYDNNAYATFCSSFTSSLPNAYADTQFLDSNNEYNIAVGTTNAHNIMSGNNYTIKLTLNVTNSSSSRYKVQGQEGYYVVYPSTLTTFAETTSKIAPFATGFTAPETRSWRHETEPNATISSAAIGGTTEFLSGTIATATDEDYYFRVYSYAGSSATTAYHLIIT